VTGIRVDRDLSPAIVGGVGYLLLAWGAILLTADGRFVSILWPADALTLALILPIAARRWTPYCAMALAANFLANGLAYGWSVAFLFYGAANLAGIVTSAWFLRGRMTSDKPLENLGSAARFVLLGAIAGPCVSAAVGALTAHFLFGQSAWASFWRWYAAVALGTLIFTPLFMGMVSGEFVRWLREMNAAVRLEAIAILTLVLGSGLFTFLIRGYPILFLMAAPVMLATFRLGRYGTKLSLIIVACIGSICTIFGHGPIAAMIADPGRQVMFLQFYLAILLFTTLPVSAELHARRALARRLAESEASLRLLASESADGLVRIDLDGLCIQLSGATPLLLGADVQAIAGMRLADIIDDRDGEALAASLRQALASPGTVTYCEFRPRGEGEEWLECTLRALVDAEGKTYGAIGAIRNITMRKEREISLARAASTDSLTGALNHAAFMGHLDRALARGAGHRALVMIDIDHFKQVNDGHGHAAGDAVLVELLVRLRALIRDQDIIGRLGGDEIAILLEGAPEDLARSIAERIRKEVSARPILLRNGVDQPISISCGVAQALPGMSRAELTRRADVALYRAKAAGRDRIEVSVH